jgi:uncharacterized protein YoxC
MSEVAEVDEEEAKKERIKKLGVELQEMTFERTELVDLVGKLYTDEEQIELEVIKQQVEELTARAETIHEDIKERDEQLFDDLKSSAADIEKKEKALKAACCSLALSSFKKTQYFKAGRVRVSVGTTRVITAYRTGIIKKHPELLKLSADGDPVVKQQVDAAVLDRLIAEDKFSKEDAKEFLLESKSRNPSVRITWAEEDEE